MIVENVGISDFNHKVVSQICHAFGILTFSPLLICYNLIMPSAF
jgi:hypothetical protein